MPAPDDTPHPPIECRLVRVHGRVQGVGFREACVQQAESLGLTGWVRNRRDGSVETLLQGPAEALARMEHWLRQGPPSARVERLTCTPLSPPFAPPFALLGRFERRPTE